MSELVSRCYKLQSVIDECLARIDTPAAVDEAPIKKKRRNKEQVSAPKEKTFMPNSVLRSCNAFLEKFIQALDIEVLKKKLIEKNPVPDAINSTIDQLLVDLPTCKDGREVTAMLRRLKDVFCDQISVCIGANIVSKNINFAILGDRLNAYSDWSSQKGILTSSRATVRFYLTNIVCFASGVLSVFVFTGMSLYPYVLPSLLGGTIVPVSVAELYYYNAENHLKSEFNTRMGKICSQSKNLRST